MQSAITSGDDGHRDWKLVGAAGFDSREAARPAATDVHLLAGSTVGTET